MAEIGNVMKLGWQRSPSERAQREDGLKPVWYSTDNPWRVQTRLGGERRRRDGSSR